MPYKIFSLQTKNANMRKCCFFNFMQNNTRFIPATLDFLTFSMSLLFKYFVGCMKIDFPHFIQQSKGDKNGSNELTDTMNTNVN